jgi:hypothetical protein
MTTITERIREQEQRVADKQGEIAGKKQELSALLVELAELRNAPSVTTSNNSLDNVSYSAGMTSYEE